jgi:dolichol-phosphate mannosyltransferase
MSEPIVSVVLPTYNEAQSLPVVVPRILATLASAGIAAEVIVVDDASPDGTAEVARALAEHHAVRTLHRTAERGLATAVLAGFAMSRAQVCVVMDADGSHPVEALPGMVRMIVDDKCDVVVGSRHVTGGGSHNWPVFSQLKSKFAASLTFGITSMTDPTTGFMAIRRDLLEDLELDPVGWKIVLEIVVKAAPVRVAEVPIVFADRELGESKQSLGVFWQYVEHLGRLYGFRYPGLVEFLKFCIVGLLGVGVDLGTVWALKQALGWDTRLCAVGGFCTAVTTNFLFNRNWTFRGAARLPWLASYATFVGASLLGLSVRMLTVHALIVLASMDQGYGYLLSNLIGIGLATLFNFVGAKFFAFDSERLDFSATPDPQASARPSAARPRPIPTRACAALLACAAAYAFASGVLDAQLRTDDEGVNVTMARNVMESSALLLRPSVVPGGLSDWLAQDLPLLGNTPFFAALLALGGLAAGLHGMAALSFLAFACTVFFTHRLLALEDRRAAWFAIVPMAVSPSLHAQFSLIEFEPTLTALCAAGLYCFVRGARDRRLPFSFLGGALFGLGFLTKLWLITPYALAATGFLVVHGLSERVRRGGRSGVRRHVLAAALGFALCASLHLAWVALRSPADLVPWIESVYLGIFSGRGVTGAKLSAIGQYAAIPRPVWFYPLQLYRDQPFLLPLCAFGLPALARQARGSLANLLALLFGGLLGVVILSIPAVKEPLYVLAVTPFLYMLAGLSLAALSADLDTYHRSNASVVKAVNLLCVTLVCASVLWFVMRPHSGGLSGTQLAAHATGLLLPLIVGTCWTRGLGLLRPLLACAAAVLPVWVGIQTWMHTSLPHAELAHVLAPLLADAPPQQVTFIAPHSRILTGYLHRAGRDWTAQGSVQDSALRAFVIPPTDESGLGVPVGDLPHKMREFRGPGGYRVLARITPEH